jgi:recombination protein RecT
MNAVAEAKPASQLAVARDQFEKMNSQFAMALPAHIPVERFVRVVMTAVGANADLLAADRASLFEASIKAAQDGLLPDGRDGALVIYNTKIKENGKDIWIKKVQWMPMIAGVLKKIRNSGELMSISSNVAYEKDKFFYRLGDDEAIEHEPYLEGDPGKPRLVYAIARTKDGGVYREVMTVNEVEKVRAVSRAAQSGPWVQWWGEMARKTVLRRLAKRLPMSTDLDDLIRRDDALYAFDEAKQDAKRTAPRSLAGKLDALAKPSPRDVPAIEHQPAHDAETGEIQADPVKVTSGTTRPPAADPSADEAGPAGAMPDDADEGRFPPPDSVDDSPSDRPSPIEAARQRGREAKEAGLATRAMPGEYRAEGREAEAAAWMEGHKAASVVEG